MPYRANGGNHAVNTTTRILTASWFTELPGDDHVRIGISRGVPRGIGKGYRRYTPLNPGPWFKTCGTPLEYLRRYYDEVLKPLDPRQVVDELTALSDGKVPVLVCFEGMRPEDGWCHRALVSTWLYDELGLPIPEFGHEDAGCGWSHPKLHPSLRP